MDSKKAIYLIIIIVICALLIGLQLKGQKNKSLNCSSMNFQGYLKPCQEFISGVGRNISGFWLSINKGYLLEKENKILRSRIYALKEEQDRFIRTREENRELRKLLEVSRNTEGNVVAAEVIARSPDNWFKTLKVNKGYKDGVVVNMAVISSEGLVGKVIATGKNISNVRLIFNEKSAIPAQLVSSGEMGVVYGEGKKTCVMKFVNADTKVKVGDQVVTSNLSKIYPPGKVIGKISKLYGRDKIMYQAVQIKPAVKFSNLEFVLLIEPKFTWLKTEDKFNLTK